MEIMSLHPLEPIPAVRRLETDRPDLLAVEIAGHVTGADVENLFGLLEGAYALHRKLDLLMRFVDHEGVDWSEVSRETAEEGREHAARHIRRCAAIGDREAAKRFMHMFAPSPEGEARRFAAGEEAEAWAWMNSSGTAG